MHEETDARYRWRFITTCRAAGGVERSARLALVAILGSSLGSASSRGSDGLQSRPAVAKQPHQHPGTENDRDRKDIGVGDERMRRPEFHRTTPRVGNTEYARERNPRDG